MTSKLTDLNPTSLWTHFAEFLKIPHCSGNEKAIGDYIVSVAKRNQLEWQRDGVGNVVVSKPASPGMEKSPGVILQGHLDMVCEKNSDVEHDFSQDPIQAEIIDDWIQAKGTTLGADNGIGNAAALAIMEDKTLNHPPLEFLFTVEEETGLTGATQIKPDFLKGTRLLNLDSEDEGEFTIGCAGGADSLISFPLSMEPSKEDEEQKIKLTGLQGGHSGVDINLGRGNAIKLLARLLFEAGKEVPFRLGKIEGGNLRNAIPREAWATLKTKPGKSRDLKEVLEKAFDAIKTEFKVMEPDSQLQIEKSDKASSAVLTTDSQKKLVDFLFTLPHGVIAWHPEMAGLVETSTNLAVIRTTEEKAEIVCSTRSSVASALQGTRNSLVALSELAGAEIMLEEGYPGWKPNLQSDLLQKLTDVYKELFNKEPHIAAIHAGLECGIIGEKYPGMDMISFGPTIKFPHSPSEKVHIPSVESFWKFLVVLLEELS